MTDTTHWHSLGAFRGCDTHGHHHGINYEAVTEAHGPDVVAAMIAAGDRARMLCPAKGGTHRGQDCYAVLDICDEIGDVIADRCIPTRAAFKWWTGAVELRANSSDCPDEEPETYAVTYAYLGGAR